MFAVVVVVGLFRCLRGVSRRVVFLAVVVLLLVLLDLLLLLLILNGLEN